VSRKLAALSRIHGDEVYTRFIHLVSHLELPPNEARHHWNSIALHTLDLTRRLERPIDFRVGLTDYFVHLAPRIRSPKIIEIHLFNATQEGILKDGLTGLYNFRFFKEAITREMGQARRLEQSLSLLFVDVDHFKNYNDQLGHAAGNDALVSVARVLKETVRDMDLACRYGGEEFAVLLPATGRAGALRAAERIVMGVEFLRILHPGGPGWLTVSAGVASYPDDARDADSLVGAADTALYRAKSLGRNRALAFSPERRQHARFPMEFRGALAEEGHQALSLEGRDVSQGGLFFVTGKSVPEGHSVDLIIEFPAQGISERVSCKARVARCLHLDAGSFGIGVSLTHIAPADRLRYFQALTAARRCGNIEKPN
jgi:diguanylate cyclase (GGDEF)-like protein